MNAGPRLLTGTVIALALVAIGVLGWRANLLGVRTERPFGSVATAFDLTPPYPGYVWTRDGRPVSTNELATMAGPDHCGWGSATFLLIGWPPGTFAATAARARQYIRDPHGVIQVPDREPLQRDVKLPADARATGYRLGAIELYLSPSDEDRWIYVVGPSNVERWPRGDPMVLCA